MTKDKQKKNPKAKTEELQAKAVDLENKLRRALADYDNLEKRIIREKEDFVKFSTAGLIDKLLGVLDDLERVEKHLKNEGLRLALEQLRGALKSEGVEEIKAEGEEFNPETMDCVEIVKGPKNIVNEVSFKGYLLRGKVIRPAKVKVGKGEQK